MGNVGSAVLIVMVSIVALGVDCPADDVSPEDCDANTVFVTEGCGPVPDEARRVDDGCYRPCEDEPCPGQLECARVFYDPCYQADCLACGGSIDVCVAP